jgi:hypothetical protein
MGEGVGGKFNPMDEERDGGGLYTEERKRVEMWAHGFDYVIIIPGDGQGTGRTEQAA